MRFESREPFADRRGLAQDFILEHIALRLELGPHLGSKGIHLTSKSGLLCPKWFKRCFGRLLR